MNAKTLGTNKLEKIKGSSQSHGKIFEDMIKATFPGASDNKRKNTSKFDIEGSHDKTDARDTEVKAKKQNKNGSEVFEMADARKFFSLKEDFRLVVGLFKQEEKRKTFVKIIEYTIKKEDIEKLKGDLSYEEVNNFHNKICSFAHGEKGQKKGRAFCKKHKKDLQQKTLTTLNPKIGSTNQRRLQCSIKRKTLESILPESQIKTYSDSYRGLCLSFSIMSEARKLRKNKA